jgi:hypothetical protein
MVFLFIFLFILFLTHKNKLYERFDNNDIELVISRYNEDLKWLENEPFNKYKYIVYNKGNNDNFYKSDNFKGEIKLPNVGRETHSYLIHIINNYDNHTFSNITVFLPGSIELEHKYERGKKLLYEIEKTNNSNVFSCIFTDKPVREVFNHFQIDNYISSNNNNRNINNDPTIEIAEVRPFGEWYSKIFNNINIDNNCFTQNALFGITKETIFKNSKSYYEDLIVHVDKHHNPEAGHYFERSWDTVFMAENTLYV